VIEPPVDAGADDGLKSNVTSLDTERKKREREDETGAARVDCAPAATHRRSHTAWRGCGCTACGGGLREIGQTSRIGSVTMSQAPSTWCATCARSSHASGCKTITQGIGTEPTGGSVHGRRGSAHAHRGEQVRRSCAACTGGARSMVVTVSR